MSTLLGKVSRLTPESGRSAAVWRQATPIRAGPVGAKGGAKPGAERATLRAEPTRGLERAAVACGVFTRRWWRVGVAVVIGALMVAAPLALSLPGKATGADAMNTQLSPLFTAKTVAGAERSLSTMEAMSTQLTGQMLPALAQMLNMQPAQLNTYLATNFPALASGLSTMPQSMAQFKALVMAFGNSLTDYNDIKSTQFTPIVWTMIATGGFVLLVGLLGAADLTRRRQSVVAVSPS